MITEADDTHSHRASRKFSLLIRTTNLYTRCHLHVRASSSSRSKNLLLLQKKRKKKTSGPPPQLPNDPLMFFFTVPDAIFPAFTGFHGSTVPGSRGSRDGSRAHPPTITRTSPGGHWTRPGRGQRASTGRCRRRCRPREAAWGAGS